MRKAGKVGTTQWSRVEGGVGGGGGGWRQGEQWGEGEETKLVKWTEVYAEGP